MPLQALFATCPRGLEPVLVAELERVGATAIVPTGGGAAFAGDDAVCYRANLESRVATRILRRLAHIPYHARAGDLRRRARGPVARVVRREPVDPRRRQRHALSAEEPRLRHAAHQGRGVRPLSRGDRRAPRRRHARTRRAHRRLPRCDPLHALSRHLGRAAAPARLPRPHRRGADSREPRRRHHRALRLGRRRAVPRSRCAAAARSWSRPR